MVTERLRKLCSRIKSSGGRSYGKISAPRRGAYSRQIYRSIDLKRNSLFGLIGTILRLEHDHEDLHRSP